MKFDVHTCSSYDVVLLSQEVKKIILEKRENAGSHDVFGHYNSGLHGKGSRYYASKVTML